MPIFLKKIKLPILDEKGKEVSGGLCLDMQREYDFLEDGGEFDDVQMAQIVARGKVLDCQKQLIAVISRASDSVEGMGEEEIEQISSIIDKIDALDAGMPLILEQIDYEFVCKKVRLPYLPHYNKPFHIFMRLVLVANAVPLVEEVSASAQESKNGDR